MPNHPIVWSPAQEAVFEAVTAPRGGNLIIRARAGAAKTSTIVEAANRLPDNLRCVFLAFNKSIADTLVERLPEHVEARTFHSLCMRALLANTRGPRPKVDDKKLYFIADEMAQRYTNAQIASAQKEPAPEPPTVHPGFDIIEDTPDPETMLEPFEMDHIRTAVRLCGLAKNEGIGIIKPDEPDVWDAIIDRYDLEIQSSSGQPTKAITPAYYFCDNCQDGYHHASDDCHEGVESWGDADLDERHGPHGWTEIQAAWQLEAWRQDAAQASPRQIVVNVARKLLTMSNTDTLRIDFDDMLYLCALRNCRFQPYDIVFTDESQDLNELQLHLLKQILRAGGRLVAVGDENQAVYLFRGAGANSMDRIAEEFHCRELSLDVSYRCAKAIITTAQGIVPKIQAAPWAEAGTVYHWMEPLGPDDAHFKMTDFRPDDVVLCRLTAPLVTLAYKLIGKQIGCRVLGRAIGDGLVTLIRRTRARTLPALREMLDQYQAEETQRLIKQHREEQAALVEDKVMSINAAINALPPGASVQDLIVHIQGLFSHDNDRGLLTLCTAHRSKGLEWDRVFILEPRLFPSKFAKTDDAVQQEHNLLYVAITRAKRELHYLPAKAIA